jgi:hypothetical protein
MGWFWQGMQRSKTRRRTVGRGKVERIRRSHFFSFSSPLSMVATVMIVTMARIPVTILK